MARRRIRVDVVDLARALGLQPGDGSEMFGSRFEVTDITKGRRISCGALIMAERLAEVFGDGTFGLQPNRSMPSSRRQQARSR